MMTDEDFAGTADDVIEMAVAEMGTRLKDRQRRKQIPDHVIAKFLGEAGKVAERREQERRIQEAAASEMNVLQVVRGSDLPADRKRILIETEIARLKSLIQDLEGELDA